MLLIPIRLATGFNLPPLKIFKQLKADIKYKPIPIFSPHIDWNGNGCHRGARKEEKVNWKSIKVQNLFWVKSYNVKNMHISLL